MKSDLRRPWPSMVMHMRSVALSAGPSSGCCRVSSSSWGALALRSLRAGEPVEDRRDRRLLRRLTLPAWPA